MTVRGRVGRPREERIGQPRGRGWDDGSTSDQQGANQHTMKCGTETFDALGYM